MWRARAWAGPKMSSALSPQAAALLTPQQPLSLPELGEDDDLFTEALLSYGEVSDGTGKRSRAPDGGGLGGLQYSQPNNVEAKLKACFSAHPRALAGGVAGGLILLIIILATTLSGGHPGQRPVSVSPPSPSPPPPPHDRFLEPYRANGTNSARIIGNGASAVGQLLLWPGDAVTVSMCSVGQNYGDAYLRLMAPTWPDRSVYDQNYEVAHNDDGCGLSAGGAKLTYNVPCGSSAFEYDTPKSYSVIMGCFSNGPCMGQPYVIERHRGCAPPPPAPPRPGAWTLPSLGPFYVNNGACSGACNSSMVLEPGYSYTFQTVCDTAKGDTILALHDKGSFRTVAVNDDAPAGFCQSDRLASAFNYTVPCSYNWTTTNNFILSAFCYYRNGTGNLPTCNATLTVTYKPLYGRESQQTGGPEVDCWAAPSTSSDYNDLAPPAPWGRRQ